MMFAVVRLRVEGFHQWRNAPMARDYLGVRHRHMFHIEVGVPVDGHDREVEFHDLRDIVRDALPAEPCEFGGQSCEMIATDIREHVLVTLMLPSSCPVRVAVFEDGECGAVLE